MLRKSDRPFWTWTVLSDMKKIGLLVFVFMLPLIAAAGDGAGDFQTAMTFYEGSSEQPPDYGEAVRLFRIAAEKGHVEARTYLGMCYLNGQGTVQNYAEAFKWIERAAGAGDLKGQYLLGEMYRSGHGVGRDFEKARLWFDRAARQDYAPAQSVLAGMYASGQQIGLNYVLAHMWWNILAAGGSEEAGRSREKIEQYMSSAQIAKAQKLAREYMEKR